MERPPRKASDGIFAGGLGVDLSGLDALAAFKSRMDADAGVQRALKAEGLA